MPSTIVVEDRSFQDYRSFTIHFIVCFFLLMMTGANAQSVIPGVPDISQPPATVSNGNWCAPTAAVNITEYWERVMCSAGANGIMNAWSAGVANDSIGWFMDTNGSGSPDRSNPPHPGTFNRDIQPGLFEFMRWDRDSVFSHPTLPNPGKIGYDWFITTDMTAASYDLHTTEIDSGRPTIITFKYWHLLQPSVLQTVNGEAVEFFAWDVQVSTSGEGEPDETWNLENGDGGIGHAVTGIGYARNYSPGGGLPMTDWVIVQDNWPSTPANIAVPWQNWTSVTKVKMPIFMIDAPFSSSMPTVDGSVTASEYNDADSLQFIHLGDTSTVYFKVDGTNFYAGLVFSDISASSSARIYFDTAYDRTMASQSDDYRFVHTLGGNAFYNVGNGSAWSADMAPSGWTSAVNMTANNWQAEFRIPYSLLGITAGIADTLGISFWDEGTGNGDHRWPNGSEDSVPCSWGDVLSSDLFVPVELTVFTAQVRENNHVELRWTTATESDNFGFEIQRKMTGEGFKKIGFVTGAGTVVTPRHYVFVDTTVVSESYFYRLKQIDNDGTSSYTQIQDVTISAPRNFVLSQNYPNPFNPGTEIVYYLSENITVELGIYNVAGRKVRTLLNMKQPTGRHSAYWDGTGDNSEPVSSGIYIYRLRTGKHTASKKMLLIR